MSEYLTEEELLELDGALFVRVASLAIGPDGLLYILDIAGARRVYVSDGPHRASIFADLRESDSESTAAIVAGVRDEVLLYQLDGGIFRLSRDRKTLVYPWSELMVSTTDCHFSWAARGETIYYSPGCYASLDDTVLADDNDLYVGAIDGRPLEKLFDVDRVDAELGPYEHGPGFLGSVAPHPSGGVITHNGHVLLCVDDDGRYVPIFTDPPLDTRFPFHNPIGVDGHDRIYLQVFGLEMVVGPD